MINMLIEQIHDIEDKIYHQMDRDNIADVISFTENFVNYIGSEPIFSEIENLKLVNQLLTVLEESISNVDMVGINDILNYEVMPVLLEVQGIVDNE